MRISALLVLSLLPTMALAAPYEPKDQYITNCHITPAINNTEHYPGRNAIVPSNKLALPAGKSHYADGELVTISGRVFDENCVPVSDAIVEIWQTGPDGKYVKTTLSGRMSSAAYFTGSGRAITDNLGRFDFVTLFPGQETRKHKHEDVAIRAPFIHVRVMHEKFSPLTTEMFFGGDRRNDTDKIFMKLPSEKQDLLAAHVWKRATPEDGVAVQWDITLRGKNEYRKF